MTRRGAIAFLAVQGLAVAAAAAPPSCTDPATPCIVLRTRELGNALAEADVLRHLAAGLAPSGVAVCSEASASPKRVAEIEMSAQADAAQAPIVRIWMEDAVTNKILERSVDLAATPRDSRAVLIALYVEELVQASWIETSLKERVYLRDHPGVSAPEVQREIAAALPDDATQAESSAAPKSRSASAAASVPLPQRSRVTEEPRVVQSQALPGERPFVLSLGGALLLLGNRLTQVGPELSFGWIALPWLQVSAHLSYRLGPRVPAPHGEIDVQSLLFGLSLAPVWRVLTRLSLLFPQAIEGARVNFAGHADAGSEQTSAVRMGVLLSHGVGVRIALNAWLALGATARFCWTLLPADAADDGRVVTGIAGLGGEGTLALETRF